MKNPPETDALVAATKRAQPHFGRFLTAGAMLGLLLTLGVTRVHAQDDDYLTIYGQIQQADDFAAKGKTVRAHNLYFQARQAMAAFKQEYPDWKTPTVNYRLKYLDEKIAATSSNAIPPAATSTATAPAMSTAAVASASSDAAPVTTSAATSPVKLIDAGSEPRTVLTLHPTVGDKQTVTMTMKMSMNMSMGANAMPSMAIPTMVLPMTSTVTEVSPAGEISYSVVLNNLDVVADASSASATAEAMKTALTGMNGMTGTGKMSSKGIMNGMTMQAPPGASPQATQMANQMKDFSGASIAFPDEPVGAGAKWEYVTQVKSQGMAINQTTDYQLVSIDGDKVTLQSTYTQSAANQTIENPSMPGLKLKLTHMSGSGGGSTTMSLGQIMPQLGTVKADSDVVMAMGQQGNMEVKTGVNVTIQAK